MASLYHSDAGDLMSETSDNLNKKLLLIVNPVAGKKQMTKKLCEVVELFTRSGYAVTVMPTTAAGDAAEYVRKLGAGYDLICCSGGDGTMGETVTGLVDANLDVPVGYLPSGSTNDFAAFHGLSDDVMTAARNIVTGTVKPVDVGVFNGSCFINSAEFGAFTWQAYTTPQRLKNLIGGKAYLLEAIKDLNRLKSEHLRVNIGEEEFIGDYIFGVMAASCSIADKALKNFRQPVLSDDGLIEIALVKKPTSLPDRDNLVVALRNGDPNTKVIQFCRSDSICFTSDVPVDWNVDGEKRTVTGELEIKVLKQRLKLMC